MPRHPYSAYLSCTCIRRESARSGSLPPIEKYHHQKATMSSDEESVGSNASEEEITDLSNR